MIFQESEFFGDGGGDEGELVGEFVVSVRCKVVFLDVRFCTPCIEGGDSVKVCGERVEGVVEAFYMRELIGDVAFEAGYSEGEGVESEGKVIGTVSEGTAEGVFDAVADESDPL